MSLGLASLIASVLPAEARADSRPVVLDRVIARWRTVEENKSGEGHLIFARELAFEARLEAMALGDRPDARLVDRHIRAALARHVTESLLELLPLEPTPPPQEVADRAELARKGLIARVGGEERLMKAQVLERFSDDEVDAMLRRTARASLYLDRMVAPLVVPTDFELREMHASGQTPFTSQRFADCIDKLRRWVIGQRLAATLDDFWQRTRSRIVITWAVEEK
ncbi:MAG: hypothetical protein U0271_13250 [Polyangiaceae bacterium]